MYRRDFIRGVVAVSVAGMTGCMTDESNPADVQSTDREFNIQDAAEDGGNDRSNELEAVDASSEDLVLTLDDFGAGWRSAESDTANESRLVKSGSPSYIVISKVDVYDSVQEARDVFDERVAEWEEEHSSEYGGVGYESKLFLIDRQGVIVFRERNVVAEVMHIGSYYDTREHVKEQAQKVLDKVELRAG